MELRGNAYAYFMTDRYPPFRLGLATRAGTRISERAALWHNQRHEKSVRIGR